MGLELELELELALGLGVRGSCALASHGGELVSSGEQQADARL